MFPFSQIGAIDIEDFYFAGFFFSADKTTEAETPQVPETFVKPRLNIHSTAPRKSMRGVDDSCQDLLVIECGLFLRVVYFVPVACLGSCETITSGGRQGRKFTLSRSHCTAVID